MDNSIEHSGDVNFESLITMALNLNYIERSDKKWHEKEPPK